VPTSSLRAVDGAVIGVAAADGTSILTIIMPSDVWCLVEMQQWPMQHRIAVVESFMKSESVTAA